jgi:hypothetical protein
MLEYAVRPYQTPNSQGKIIIPSTPGSTTQRATITWGAQSTIPPANKGFNVVCCSEQLNELERQGETVRIQSQQADDDTSPSYVDVFRSNKLKLNKKSNDSHPCDSPLDQYLGAEFGLDDTGDATIDLGWAGTPDADTSQCGVTWALNNNTAAAGATS